MSKLIDQAVSHFSSQAVRTLEVPEWGVTVYAKRLTLEDKAKWLARSKDDSSDYLIYSVIFGALDERGEQLFDVGDKVKLRSAVDPEILSRIANFVLKIESASEVDREKNS